MTKHNLRAHLSWLLQNQPSIPPAGSRIPGPATPTIQFEEDLKLEDDESGVNIGTFGENLFVEDFAGGAISHDISWSSLDSAREILKIEQKHTEDTTSDQMARLQSAPRSINRSRLVSHNTPEPRAAFSPVVNNEDREPYKSHGRQKVERYKEDELHGMLDDDRVNGSTRHTPRLETPRKMLDKSSPSRIKSPYGLDKIDDFMDIDTIDLTADARFRVPSSASEEEFGEPRSIWREDSAARAEPPSTRGKKRKSDEIARDMFSGTHSESRMTGGRGVRCYVDTKTPRKKSLEDPPPPYSTIADPSFQTVDMPTSNILESKQDSERYALDRMEIRTEPRTRKSVYVSNVSGSVRSLDASMPPIKSDRSARVGTLAETTPGRLMDQDDTSTTSYTGAKSSHSPSKSGSRLPKARPRVIADSEDDEDDVGVEENILSLPQGLESLSSTSRTPTREADGKQQTPIKLRSPGTLIPASSETLKFAAPSSKHASAPESMNGFSSQAEKAALPFSDLPMREQDDVVQFLQKKYQAEGSLKQMQADLEKNSSTRFQYIDDDLEVPRVLEDEASTLRHNIETLNNLLQAANDYDELIAQKESHRKKTIEKLNKGLECKAEAEQNKQIISEIRRIQRKIAQLLGTNEITYVARTSPIAKVPEQSFMSLQPEIIESTQYPTDNVRPLQRHLTSVARSTTPESHPSSLKQYFSPSKRSQGIPVQQRPNPLRSADLDRRPPGSPSREVDSILGDTIDTDDFADDVLFTTTMGSPPTRHEFSDAVDPDFHYEGGATDEDMLEAANYMEITGTSRAFANEDRTTTNHIAAAQVEHGGSGIDPRDNRYGNVVPPHSQNALLQYPWSREVKSALRQRFHLTGFRTNQLEAINTTLSGKDTFVLMPTGGGKSLCYQLPAVVRSGKTNGVTVVVSPLLSLMQDQVDHLRKLDIKAVLFNGELSAEERRHVLQTLRSPTVELEIQVLYVTPEMLTRSQTLINAFQDLFQSRKFARFVIDEAHCVSQWGHDFRPDYKALGEVRQRFRGVPLMALTATATENVKMDVKHNLGMGNCLVFQQTFNRPNLTYEIRPKTKNVLEDIAELITSKYQGRCGIIYCLSRKSCENVAQKLCKKHGIKAAHYHAGMDTVEKQDKQRAWQKGKIHVIVATIAFGMGIDKPDVRFVIHHTLPKSLEGYYQETGRAGRDGKRSGCYLYYSYGDVNKHKHMIKQGEGSPEQKDRQYKMLRQVALYCDNRSDCRRVQVLAYFGERFMKEECHNTCDNCSSNCTFESVDFTEYAATAIQLVKVLQQTKVTLLYCVDVFRGVRTKKISSNGHDKILGYGAGSNLERGEVERLFYRLMSEDALAEFNQQNGAGFPVGYVILGPKYREFLDSRRRLKIQVRISPNGKASIGGISTGVAAARQPPLSTNVSSPIQAASRRHRTRQGDMSRTGNKGKSKVSDENLDDFIVPDHYSDTASDSEDDAFEPVRQAGKLALPRSRELGPPIRRDLKMESLNEVHRMIVEDFVETARKKCENIVIQKSLRAQPFTLTILREMAINFPKDEEEMKQIPNIDPCNVDLYAKEFLKLIRLAQDRYEFLLQEQEDRPYDPNHVNVVEISSDDDGLDDQLDLSDLEPASEGESSAYFNGQSHEYVPAQANFSDVMAQSRYRPPTPPLPAWTLESKRPRKPSGNGVKGGPRRFYKKASGGSSKGHASTSRTATSRRTSYGTKAGGSGLSVRRNGGGATGSRSTGIAMMPT